MIHEEQLLGGGDNLGRQLMSSTGWLIECKIAVCETGVGEPRVCEAGRGGRSREWNLQAGTPQK